MTAAEVSRSCTARGVVVASTAGLVEIALEPPARCPECNGACRWYAPSGAPPTISLRAGADLAVGTAVTVSVGGRELLRGAALVFGLPLAGLLAGALLGFALAGSDLATAVGGAAGLAAALAVARGLRARLERRAHGALTVVPAH